MAGFGAIHAIKGVAETLQRETRRVESQEHLVQDPTTPEGSDTENDVESDTGTVTDTSKDKPTCQARLATLKCWKTKYQGLRS